MKVCIALTCCCVALLATALASASSVVSNAESTMPLKEQLPKSSLPMSLQILLGLLGLAPKEERAPSKALQVIGAGLPKTGTKSLQMALETLGHSVYDSRRMGTAGHLPELAEVLERNASVQGPLQLRGQYPAVKTNSSAEREHALDVWVEAMLEDGATATLDGPLCFFWEELFERFPDAKVILGLRPRGAESWHDSLQPTLNTVAALRGWPYSFLGDIRSLEATVLYATPTATIEPHYWRPWWAPWINLCTTFNVNAARQQSTKRYRDHQQWVRDRIPESQLLEWKVTDGWAPLCKFLNVNASVCPNTPFPRSNARHEMIIAMWVVRTIAVTYPFIVAGLLWLVWKLVGCCVRRKTTYPEDATKKQR